MALVIDITCLHSLTIGLQNFLKALGYLSISDRPPEVEERIQMHADTLYHRMLAQEAAIEEAKAAGKPVPSFPPLTPAETSAIPQMLSDAPAPSSSQQSNINWDQLEPSVQKKLKKRLENLDGKERELEERAIAAEMTVGAEVSQVLTKLYEVKDEDRRKRKEEGRQTVGDRFREIFNR